MNDIENNKSFDFIMSWPEVLAKLSSVEDLLSVKMVVISKSPFDPKNVHISQRDDVLWYKGIPFICIASSVYGCVQDHAEKTEMRRLNSEWIAAVQSSRIYIKHVLTFPEYKVDPRINELTRKAVTKVLKEKLKTSNLIIEETYMYSAELPPMELIVEYSNSRAVKEAQSSVEEITEIVEKAENKLLVHETSVTKSDNDILEKHNLEEISLLTKDNPLPQSTMSQDFSPSNKGSNKHRLDGSSLEVLHDNVQNDSTSTDVEVIPSDAVEVSEVDIAEFMSGLGEIVFVGDGKQDEVLPENAIDSLINVRVQRVAESISVENMNQMDEISENDSHNHSYSSGLCQNEKVEDSIKVDNTNSNLKRKYNPDSQNHYLINLAKKMASEFCQLSAERQEVFREKTIHLLKSLVDEQEVEDAVISTLKPEHIKYCKSGNAFFLNGQLYKFV